MPSLTELLWDLGLASQLVGRTGFCVHPREGVRGIPKVGGTKDVNLSRVRELAPTHLVVNVDENRREVVEELARFVPHVIVTHPLGPRDNLALYRLLGGIFGRETQAQRLCQEFETSYSALLREAAAWARQSVLYLVWKKPWMTVSRDTYISRTLALVGWDTVPARSEARYPRVELDPATLAGVDWVLLSTEPYRFRERQAEEVRALLPSGCCAKVELIDGEMVSWYGSRAILGLRYLKKFRKRLEG